MPRAFRRWTVDLVAEWKARVALLAAMNEVEGQRDKVDPATSCDPQSHAGPADSARSGPQQENQVS